VQLASSGVGLGGGVDDGTDVSNGRKASIYLESLSLLSPPRIVTPAQVLCPLLSLPALTIYIHEPRSREASGGIYARAHTHTHTHTHIHTHTHTHTHTHKGMYKYL